MTPPTSNARTLLLRIFEAWRADCLASYSEGAAFEIFASELILRPYSVVLEDVKTGIVGGGQDGAIDSVYVFFDDNLIDEDSEVVDPSSKPSDFSQDRLLELWIIQTKTTPAFAETTLDQLENSIRRLLDLAQPLDSLGVLYNERLLGRIGLFRKAWNKLLITRPRISINVVYATPGDRQGVTPQVEAKLSALRQVIADAVPDPGLVTVELLGDKELLNRYNERPSYTVRMEYQESATSGNSHVALVKLKDYYDLIVDENGRLRRHLFEWNVRDYQGNVEVNKGIRKSLTSSDSPEFWWLNNGVTILCSDATSVGKAYSLTNIQIVNGLQTSHEIYETLRNYRTPETENKMLLVRVIVTADAPTRDEVIRATNRQTAVTDASLRATDEVQRQIENYFLTKGWYYDRRKNFYKNDGKDISKIVGIPFLGAALTAMGLGRPDKSRGKPSSLLKNNDDYKQVFSPSIDLEIYLWAAKLQRRVDAFIVTDAANATIEQRSNLRFHLSMLITDKLNNGPVKRPQQLRSLASPDASLTDGEIEALFGKLKQWSDEFLEAEGVILERAAKAQRFSDYLLKKAADERAAAQVSA
ncbi:MAG: AIPR family protein [Streptosporangiaceae bacterium]